MGGHQAAAAFHKLANLAALLVGKRGDVRKHQYFEGRHARSIQQPVVHHFEGNARLDQRLVKTQRVILHLLTRALARCEASSNRSCTISKGMRASISAW